MGLLGKKQAAQWVATLALNEFSHTHCFSHNKHEYALYKLEDGVYCTDNSCSHEYSPLCEGMVMDGEVYCPKHGSRFDIRTGAVVNFPATTDVKTYPTKIEDGMVWILV